MSSETSIYFLSEIFPLKFDKPNLISFRLTPEVSREIANQIGWRFSVQFSGIVTIWDKGYFWAIAPQQQAIPERAQWRESLSGICEKLKEKVGDRIYSIQWVTEADPSAEVLAQLAVRILKIKRSLSPRLWKTQNGVDVKREVKFWAEEIELESESKPAIGLTLRSDFSYSKNLSEFYETHPYRQDPVKLLKGLKVRDIEKSSFATIVELVGRLGEYREKLLQRATGVISRQAIIEAPDEQPVVAVQFGRDTKKYYYAMAALRPVITSETANRFRVDYGKLLKVTRIPCEERKTLLTDYRAAAKTSLEEYGITLMQNINSKKYTNLFAVPKTDLKQVKLLFGNAVVGNRGNILNGLTRGGVYRRHADYKNSEQRIAIAVLKISTLFVRDFLKKLKEQLKAYGFDSRIPPECLQAVNLGHLSGSEARAKVEEALNRVLETQPDVILVILPQSDRNSDEDERNSLYSWISSRVLRRQVASQFIYEDTLKKVKPQYLLNQVIPGILAKLGNLPFVLAEPLDIADYFIGFDVSRFVKKKTPGTMNVCASVRLYGSQGEFINYHLEESHIEGEEIPQRILEDFLPQASLAGKTVLIYRDGRFAGDEIKHLRARERAINSNFILVECSKSGIPRLYNLNGSILGSPSRGLALRVSDREAILVTTEVPENVGLAQPLRLRIIPKEGQNVALESLVDATLKLTLLHHGSLKEPRLPIPLYGSDRIAYRRLQGIAPLSSEGDRQYWL